MLLKALPRGVYSHWDRAPSFLLPKHYNIHTGVSFNPRSRCRLLRSPHRWQLSSTEAALHFLLFIYLFLGCNTSWDRLLQPSVKEETQLIYFGSFCYLNGQVFIYLCVCMHVCTCTLKWTHLLPQVVFQLQSLGFVWFLLWKDSKLP